MLKKLYQKYLLKHYFGKYLDKKSIDRILSGTSGKEKKEEIECGYIIIEINQDKNFESTLTNILEYSHDKNVVSEIYGTIVIFYFYKKDIDTEENPNIKNLLEIFIKGIPENNLINIKCIYGIDNAKVGLFGSTLKFTYMVLLNDYIKKLAEIKNMQYGEIKEIKIMEYNKTFKEK
jgi:hypothetical protein